jgi:acyl carrier protein
MVRFHLNRQQFLEEFSEILGVSAADLTPVTELSSLETWDSVSYLSTMVLFDEKLGVAISPDALTAAKTIQDILNMGGPALQA